MLGAGIAVAMRVLILGGTGYVGAALMEVLQSQGHELAVFHRGGRRTPCPQAAACVHGERSQLEDCAPAFAALAPEVVVDAIAGSGAAVRRSLRLFAGKARLVLLSSMDVYRAWGVFHGTEGGALAAAPQSEVSGLRQHAGLYPASTMARLQALHGW
ncbi:MAG: NAD-dependent epimerase/dehydratase family protein, partial [Terriglobales bacterium]